MPESSSFISHSQFSTYEVTKKTLMKYSSDSSDPEGKGLKAVNFVSGCVAGGSGTLASFPFDVLRTRFISQGEPKVCNGRYVMEGM